MPPSRPPPRSPPDTRASRAAHCQARTTIRPPPAATARQFMRGKHVTVPASRPPTVLNGKSRRTGAAGRPAPPPKRSHILINTAHCPPKTPSLEPSAPLTYGPGTEARDRNPRKSKISAEFKRITTVPLIPKFMSQLEHYSEKLNHFIATRRACSLQALALYLNEDHEKLVEEYREKLDQMVIGIYVIKQPDTDIDQSPEDVGIKVE
ncbi:hypothetical protein ATANTOWER_021632, partial [Ataeniobius toweri]|nr:hypothetical protein [Ataeniobius toweri]